MMENLVLCMLMSAGVDEAYYWHDGSYKVDFLIDGPCKPIPIEVKSETNIKTLSLDKYCDVHNPDASFILYLAADRSTRHARMPVYLSDHVLDKEQGETYASSKNGDGAYTLIFDESQWVIHGDKWTMEIPFREHRVRSLKSVKVFQHQNGLYRERNATTMVSLYDTVTIMAYTGFTGMTAIKG